MVTLVTGATGLVGNNVVRLLLARGEAVRVLRRASASARPLAGLDVDVVEGDICDADAVRRACRGAGRVVHAAARVHIGWSGLGLQRSTNVEGTRHVACAAHAEGARLVHVSSVDALGHGTRDCPGHEESTPSAAVNCPYVVTKREAEQVVMEQVSQGLDAVIVNPAYMLGPWDWAPSSGRMLLQVARCRALIAPPGGNDFCDVRHVAGGILAAMERGATGRRYILGGQALTYFEAWRIFAEVTESRPPLFTAGRRAVRAVGLAGSFWGSLTGREPDVNSATAAISTQPHHFSSARAESELGYRPGAVRDAAATAWEWFREWGYHR